MKMSSKCSVGVLLTGIVMLLGSLSAPLFWVLLREGHRIMLVAEIWYFLFFAFEFAVFGVLLVILSFFPKRVGVPLSAVTNASTLISSSVLAVLGATGLYCAYSWFSAVVFEDYALHYPLQELFGALGTAVCLFCMMLTAVFYVYSRLRFWSKKGLLFDLWWVSVLFLPVTLLVEALHTWLSEFEEQYEYISQFLFTVGILPQ